ncbi:RHS repeat-associated core domain-containing protein [Simkania negevensis]|uniref:RHS repeat-associated core domain-containing protein n=1 Tax=Simkania negevensis TaxID=83561 RepID=UPI001305370B|nr:RHS repeat-associated core domain-containing protein [Simkania negevensis]
MRQKKACEEDKKSLEAEIKELEKAIESLLSNIAFDKAKAVFEESRKTADLAKSKEETFPLDLKNIEEVVSNLNEIGTLYEKAVTLAQESLTALTSAKHSHEESKVLLEQTIKSYEEAANHYRKEASEWPAKVCAQIEKLKQRIATLLGEIQLCADKGLKRDSYELQKQAISILEKLLDSCASDETEFYREMLAELRHSIATFEIESDQSRLTQTLTEIPPLDFKTREDQRRATFFKKTSSPEIFLQTILHTDSPHTVIPLDGQTKKSEENEFSLYTEQFYRFLIQNELTVTHLLVKVLKEGKLLHKEKVALPLKNTTGWNQYIKADGMVLIPESDLKNNFKIDLRLNFVYDLKGSFSMIVALKGVDPSYQLTISLDEEKALCECTFLQPPPWQLDALRKPAQLSINQLIEQEALSCFQNKNKSDGRPSPLELMQYEALDQLVATLNRDPLLIAEYVHHEIAFADPLLIQENGVFQAPGIHRNPYMTYLEKMGSPWEQCQLLVYLLRKAGYPASYVIGDPCSIPKDFAEKLLFTKLPEGQNEALFRYPWVIFSDGKETISLFPWMKEMQVSEGYDLYACMPDAYASADRWILRYLKRDPAITKHVGPDEDDTAGVLFSRFIEEELRKQGLFLADVGVKHTQTKPHFSSWREFPQPHIQGSQQIFDFLLDPNKTLSFAIVEIFSHTNPQKCLAQSFPLASLTCSTLPIRFVSLGNNTVRLYVRFLDEQGEHFLDLDQTDHLVDVKVSYRVPIGSLNFCETKTLSIAKGTKAALCFHFGGATSEITSKFYKQFSNEKDEKNRLHALLSFVGAAYFEKCGRAEKLIANFHKVRPTTVFAFGLAKLSPDTSKGPFTGEQDLTLPQVDMFSFSSQMIDDLSSSWNQDYYSAQRQFEVLIAVDASSNEHQILREVFKDPNAISTVKLLQLAHQKHQKEKKFGEGFIVFTSESFEAANKTPEIAQALYFPYLEEINFHEIRKNFAEQWKALESLIDRKIPLSDWTYGYMTPSPILSQDGTYKEMGTFILHPRTNYALISNNNLLSHGGLGSPLPSHLSQYAITDWKLIPSSNNFKKSYTLQLPDHSASRDQSIFESLPGTTKWRSDVRLEHKSWLNSVADPVDIITGAFYIDELDLFLPGLFPIEIRRNYNSQNPLIGDFGCGWKLSLTPYLVEQENKRYVAELDGTVIIYNFNQQNSRWEVYPEDNPDLSNFNQDQVGSRANPFQSYIENDILYGVDGSRRFFKDGLLEKWINPRGAILTFSYEDQRLLRIESSSGQFCGFYYNSEHKIAEIYASDGKRIYYDYNSQGDLIKVVLPNSATVTYEYDRTHRLMRETKPHGKVLENIYDEEGRVKEQRTPMGQQQKIVTTATFDYGDGITIVTDAGGGKTTYKIFQKQIYQIVDPLGYEILQSWYIDQNSWFDAKTEQVISSNQTGGAIRSVKETTDKRGLTTTYLYDHQGNPIQITLKGEDLTGNGLKSISKTFVYNENNLCIQEEVSGQKTLITYDPHFSYLPKKIENYAENNLISYLQLEYNDCGQIEKEDRCGAGTLWKYDTWGFPKEKIQATGTEDPDVITSYSYNRQGQCNRITSHEGVVENRYDIMGNQVGTKTFSPTGALLSALYTSYDLNNAPIWKQTANTQNTLYLDYHASGLLKATRQQLAPSSEIAYTLYEYDSRGYLIEEVDSLGYTTYRDYDALGRIKSETKEGYSTLFTYEPGGLLETITTPSGTKTICLYTTNGLLKEEIYPDGTKTSFIYDFLGRPIQETKSGITWEIDYDDSNRKVIHTHPETKTTEVYEFDQRGNLIRFTDAANYVTEKIYDGLNRLKSERSPTGTHTTWNYQNNQVICTFPNGEKKIEYYEGGNIIRTEIFDCQNKPIEISTFHYDPKTDIQQVTQGEEVTTTWINALGLPIKVQKGEIITTYEYDVYGNCTMMTDGEGQTTSQTFDGLKRLIQKELPDGSFLKYDYDLDSNLAEYHLPNGSIWKASYDVMGRKSHEALHQGKEITQQWEYVYKNGYLKEMKDPMHRIHTYQYDALWRLIQENVEGWQRSYTYDARNLLQTAEQTGTQNLSWISSWFYTPRQEHSKVERSYDGDKQLIKESIYLNDELIQETHQHWEPSSRTLQINGHERTLTYQNDELIQNTIEGFNFDYTYTLNGKLQTKTTPLTHQTIDYNDAGFPETLTIQLPDTSYQEKLSWSPTGKLASFASPREQKQFTYTSIGYLKSAGTENYEFDFGKIGTGVRTSAPNHQVSKNGLDAFGRITAETNDKSSFVTTYNTMGQVVCQGQRQYEWDPWGRLLKVSDATLTWEASYDALGRRLQTRYAPYGGQTHITTSLYDPEEEFQEIGMKYDTKTFWKIYGPNTCDAITDETGAIVFLIYDATDALASILTEDKTYPLPKTCTAYGPQRAPSLPSDLISYAESLLWHSMSQDPTGLIWMGKRYYDSISGRFLSPDPIGYPICLDPYAYANGDPVNYMDPDGRFFSAVYQPSPSFTINLINAFASTFADREIGKSQPFQIGSFDLPTGGMGWINGITSTFLNSIESGMQISRYARGANIYGVYNATHKLAADLLECGAGYYGVHTPPVQHLKNVWRHFILTHGPDEKFLQTCHSGGAIHVKNALLTSAESVRKRIIVIAIAPGAIVPKKLCFKSYNYMSKRDFVSYCDLIIGGNIKYINELKLLDPHPDAKFFDHDFLSPTFADVIQERINDYIQKYGGGLK